MAVETTTNRAVGDDSRLRGLVSACTIVIFGALFCGCLYRRLFHPLKRFPGPLLASFTNLWKVYQVAHGKYEYELLRLHQKYGRIVRIGPNHLDFSDESAVKAIYGAGRSFKKSTFYNAFTALRPSLFVVQDEEVHSAKRRTVANGFSAQSIAGMEQYIDQCMLKLMKRFDDAADCREQVDLKKWISFLVLDMLGELAFSRPFGILDNGDESLMPPVRQQVLLSMMSGQIPWVIPYVNRLAAYVPIRSIQRMIKGRVALARLAVTSVLERIEFPSNRKDLLGQMLDELNIGRDSKGRAVDILDVQTEALGLIVAGSHSTAASSTMLLWHVLTNPLVMRKLQAEIDLLPDPGTISYPERMTHNLTFMTAVINESFRINPIFVMPLPRIVPAGGRHISNAYIPAETEVTICNYALHHNEDVFGPELEVFKPERWLSDGYEKSSYLIPFSAGHRACVGRNLALAEIYKIMTSLLARYDIELVNKPELSPGASLKMPQTSSYGLAELDESMMVLLRRRSRGSD